MPGTLSSGKRRWLGGAASGTGIYQINCRLLAVAAIAAPALTAFADTPPALAAADVFEMSIEELGKLRVTSVSERSEPECLAPSSIATLPAV